MYPSNHINSLQIIQHKIRNILSRSYFLTFPKKLIEKDLKTRFRTVMLSLRFFIKRDKVPFN